MSNVYQKWYKNFVETMGIASEDELFDAFHSLLLSGQNTLALNRKVMSKSIDVTWVEAIEEGLIHIDNVLRNPRKTIVEVEEIVPIALSKKISVESIKHLAQHTDYIQSVDPVTGKITPSKILNVHKEESLLTYENKFVNTLIDRLYIFVDRRFEKLKEVSKDEEVYSLEYNTALDSETGQNIFVDLKIKTVDSLDTVSDNKGSTVWERVEKIRSIIDSYKGSSFVEEMNGAYIRPPVMRTNAILKNVDLKACLALWQFIESYDKIGYQIDTSDTAEKPSEDYIDDLYRLTVLNFLLFRSYTQDKGADILELKTKKNVKAATPKIVKRFDENNPNAYDMSVDNGAAEVTAEGEYTYKRQMPKDAKEILSDIDSVIKIEKTFFEVQEEKRLEEERIAAEKERKRLEEEARKREEARATEEKRLEAERLEEERKEKEEQEKQRLAMLDEKHRQEELERKEREAKEQAEREAREAAEQEIFQQQEHERLEKERAEREQREKEEREEKERVARETEERIAREKRDAERAQRLRAERKEIEKRHFEDIYLEYSHNPVNVLRRNFRKLKEKSKHKN